MGETLGTNRAQPLCPHFCSTPMLRRVGFFPPAGHMCERHPSDLEREGPRMPTLDDTTKNLVKNLIGDILELSPSSLSSTSNLVEDHGADPLAMARIVTALEKTLQVTIDHSDMRRMVTLQDACDVVVEARARKAVSPHPGGTGGEPVPAARPQQPSLRWSTRHRPRSAEGPRPTGHGGTQPPMVMSELR